MSPTVVLTVETFCVVVEGAVVVPPAHPSGETTPRLDEQKDKDAMDDDADDISETSSKKQRISEATSMAAANAEGEFGPARNKTSSSATGSIAPYTTIAERLSGVTANARAIAAGSGGTGSEATN